jgi:hypothetical protein
MPTPSAFEARFERFFRNLPAPPFALKFAPVRSLHPEIHSRIGHTPARAQSRWNQLVVT